MLEETTPPLEETTNEQGRGATLWAAPAIELSELSEFPLRDVVLVQLEFWVLVDTPKVSLLFLPSPLLTPDLSFPSLWLLLV